MTQLLSGLGIGASGIVGVLILAGIILAVTKVSSEMASIAIFFGVFIGIVLGLLGIVGVLKRVV